MKVGFFLLGFCALALAACSIDETTKVNDSNVISFKATTATRATAVTTNDIDAFTVWAWETVGDATIFMDGVGAARNGDSNTFATARTYYWPVRRSTSMHSSLRPLSRPTRFISAARLTRPMR